MWEFRKDLLNKPVDFLKIGHHGSINATPPIEGGSSKSGKKKKPAGPKSVRKILDAILPLPPSGKEPTAQAIVSTEREFYPSIPECEMLIELAKRVRGSKNYADALKTKGKKPEDLWTSDKAIKHNFYIAREKKFLDKKQPLRTDLEHVVTGKDFFDVKISPSR